MVSVIYGRDHAKHVGVMDQLFRLRHSVFIEGRGWSLPTRNGYEIDQYDDDEAVYFIDLDGSGEIQSSVRMTPTVSASLIADYFPHLVENGDDPRSPLIYECTRYMILPTRKNKTNNTAAKTRLLLAVVEWCMWRGLTHLQTVIDAGTLPAFTTVTLHTAPLGLKHPFGGGPGVPGGGECLAFRWPITNDVLDDIRRFGGVGKSDHPAWTHDLPSKAA